MFLTMIALALAFAPNVASADEIYMCEIVNGDSSQLITAANANLVVAPGYRLLTRTDELTHKIDIKIYKDVRPDSRIYEPRIHFDASIEEGPHARPILLPLSAITVECRNQNPDALVWSLQRLNFADKTHGGLSEKVDADARGLKSGISQNPVLDSTQLSGGAPSQKTSAN